jgi:hypothetical protein
VGEQKKAPVNTGDLKQGVEDKQADEKQYESLRPQVEKLCKVNETTENNRHEHFDNTTYLVEQLGNRIALLRPKGQTGGKIDPFLKDGPAKKIYDEAKSRYDLMEKNHQAYLANFNAAKTLQAQLPAAHRGELDVVTKRKSKDLDPFSAMLDAMLSKSVGERADDANVRDAQQASATMNPRVLEVKAADLSKLYDEAFKLCAAAIKSQQSGGNEKAKATLADAQKVLDRMEAIVTPINKDYQSQKGAIAASKDGKDVLQRLTKIVAIQRKAIEAVQSAGKQIP